MENSNEYLNLSASKSIANDTSFRFKDGVEASLMPPALNLSGSSVQKKESDENGPIEDKAFQLVAETPSQLASNTFDNLATDIVPIQNKSLPEQETEPEEKSVTELEYSYSDGNSSPPNDLGNKRQNTVSSPVPIQKKEKGQISSSPGSSSKDVPPEVMSKMENTMGADFSSVKINKNSSSAQDVGALAYTKGNQIDFAPGQFNPNTTSGQELLGHELSHVVQQREGRVKPTEAINGMAVNSDPQLEKEADINGSKAANSESPVQKKTGVSDSNPSSSIGQFKMKSETIQRKKEEDTTPVDVDEHAIAKELIDGGAKNENYVTDEVFYKRYPGINRRKLIYPKASEKEMVLVRDWIRIRNDVVRPLLNNEENPGKGDPNKKPKENPDKEIPNKEDPKKEEPKKEDPKKDKPVVPDNESPIEIPDGWTYDDYLNLLKALAEVGRLASLTVIGWPIGIVSGQAAAFLNLVQDLVHSVERKDVILGVLTLARNLSVHVNNAISDTSLAFTALQDIVLGINAIGTFFSGSAWAPVGAGITALGASVNSTVSAINVAGDAVVVFFDALVLWHLETQFENLPQDDPEKDAYKEILDGYRINTLFDLLGLGLDSLDALSGGFAHAELAEISIKVIARTMKLTHYGAGVLHTIANAIWGTGAAPIDDGSSNESEVLSLKEDESGTASVHDDNVQVALEQLFSFVSGNDMVSDGLESFGHILIENMDNLEQSFEDFQNNEEMVLQLHQQVNETLDALESKVSAVDSVLEITSGVKENGFFILEQVTMAEEMISNIEVPQLELPELDIADNPVADFFEDIVNTGAENLEEHFNLLMQELQEKLDDMKVIILVATSEVKLQVSTILDQVEAFESTMHSFQSFLREHISEARQMMDQIKDPKGIMDAVMQEIMRILGIKSELNYEEVVNGFFEFKDAAVEMYERLRAEQEAEGSSVQMKSNNSLESGANQPFSLAHSISENSNEGAVIQQKNVISPYAKENRQTEAFSLEPNKNLTQVFSEERKDKGAFKLS